MRKEHPEQHTDRPETIVAEPRWVEVGSWIVCPLVGAAGGWLLMSLAGWVASLPWAPWRGAFRMAASLPEPLGTLGIPALGLIAGLVVAYLWDRDRLVVTLSTSHITLVRGATPTHLDRACVSAVFLDGDKLIALGEQGEELVREPSGLTAVRLPDAFVSHSWPWRPEGDPYADDYRFWVEGTPDLPSGADALLKAREGALRKSGTDTATLLRADLLKLGVVVREEKTRQYWRLTKSTP